MRGNSSHISSPPHHDHYHPFILTCLPVLDSPGLEVPTLGELGPPGRAAHDDDGDEDLTFVCLEFEFVMLYILINMVQKHY